jgi:signal transduction histidine kinase
MTRLVEEAADQKHLATMMIFLAAVMHELVQQTWGQQWFDPLIEALINTLIAPAIVSLLVYAVLATFEKQQALMEEQRKKLEEAERAKLALDTVLLMSATVQHEINNPLMVIKGNIDLSLQQDPSNVRLRKVRDAVDRIREVTTLLAQIKTVRLLMDNNSRSMVDLETSVREKLTSSFLSSSTPDEPSESSMNVFERRDPEDPQQRLN